MDVKGKGHHYRAIGGTEGRYKFICIYLQPRRYVEGRCLTPLPGRFTLGKGTWCTL